MKLVALKEFRYAGQQVKAGAEFEARDRDAKVLVAVKHARHPAQGEPEQDRAELPPKRAYKRRDLQAE